MCNMLYVHVCTKLLLGIVWVIMLAIHKRILLIVRSGACLRTLNVTLLWVLEKFNIFTCLKLSLLINTSNILWYHLFNFQATSSDQTSSLSLISASPSVQWTRSRWRRRVMHRLKHNRRLYGHFITVNMLGNILITHDGFSKYLN